MKQLLTVAVLIFLAPIAALAQGLSIDGPTEPIAPKQPVWIRIVGLEPTQAAVFWPEQWLTIGLPYTDGVDGASLKVINSQAQVYAEKAGTYIVKAMAVRIEMIDGVPIPYLIPLSFTITVEGEDGPDPPPPPPPPPSESLTGLLVYEAEDLDDNPQFAKVLVSTRLRMIDKFAVRPFDVNVKNERGETPTTLQPWLKIITDNNWQLPQLLLVNEAGDLVAHKTPDSVDDAITFVTENLK